MVHASLFSGIGGPEIAAEMMGWQNAFHCEINAFCRAILDYWFPDSESYEDVTKTSFKQWKGRIDVLTGGFPCQPFSYAGKRRGGEDDRYLWPQMCRVIEEIRPSWVVGENVAGITTMVEGGILTKMGSVQSLFQEDNGVYRYELEQSFTIERISRDFESLGYSVQPLLIPAAAVGAPHRRDRVFILAHDDANNADVRTNERQPGKNGETEDGKRLQERNDISEFESASKIRSKVSRTVADATCRGNTAQEEDGSIDCNGDGQVQFAEKRRHPTKRINGLSSIPRNVTDADRKGRKKSVKSGREKDCAEDATRVYRGIERPCRDGLFTDPGMLPGKRWERFPSVPPVCRGNDGIPIRLDDLSISFAKWRTESLKAYGNAIVPQVMYMIFQAIQFAESEK